MPLASHELLSTKRAELLLDRRALRSRHGCKRPRPEHLPEHRRVLQQPLLVVGERVEPSGDDPLDGLRKCFADCAAFREHPRELLCIQGVSAGAQQQLGLRLRGKQRTFEQRREELCGLVGGERRQRDRRGIPLAASPTRAPVEQLGSRRAENEERRVLDPVRQLVDEVE